MLPRIAQHALENLASWYPAVALTGPRQSGKTTLSRSAFPQKPYVSLENPDEVALAHDDPRAFLARFPEGAILDEIQRAPQLFSWLQERLDTDRGCGRFILTGSQQFGLRDAISQSLAGRVGHLHLLPFSLQELQQGDCALATLEAALLSGGYPPIYDRNIPPAVWFADYVATYIERDVRQVLAVRDLGTFQRFLRMCAARTGQLLNLSSLAADCGISHNTAKSWIGVLEASYLIMLLPPWHRNLRKRLVKTPKLYFLDAGLAAWLAGVRSHGDVAFGSMRGPLFETWVVSEVVKWLRNHLLAHELYFLRDTHGLEIDLLVDLGGGRVAAIECKAGQTVASDWFAPFERVSQVLEIDAAAIVYGGDSDQSRRAANVVGWRSLPGFLSRLLPAEG